MLLIVARLVLVLVAAADLAFARRATGKRTRPEAAPVALKPSASWGPSRPQKAPKPYETNRQTLKTKAALRDHARPGEAKRSPKTSPQNKPRSSAIMLCDLAGPHQAPTTTVQSLGWAFVGGPRHPKCLEQLPLQIRAEPDLSI